MVIYVTQKLKITSHNLTNSWNNLKRSETRTQRRHEYFISKKTLLLLYSDVRLEGSKNKWAKLIKGPVSYNYVFKCKQARLLYFDFSCATCHLSVLHWNSRAVKLNIFSWKKCPEYPCLIFFSVLVCINNRT